MLGCQVSAFTGSGLSPMLLQNRLSNGLLRTGGESCLHGLAWRSVQAAARCEVERSTYELRRLENVLTTV